MCIAIVGNLSEGFVAYGPYEDFDEASDAHPGICGDQVWIMTLEEPKK